MSCDRGLSTNHSFTPTSSNLLLHKQLDAFHIHLVSTKTDV